MEYALREGQEPPGNLVISSDPDVISKAKSLWAAYDCGPEQLTVAIATNKPCSSANVCVWWKTQGKNQIASPNRVQLQLTQIGTAPGPVPVSAVVAEIPKAKGPKLTIVRFLAPAFYRRHISGISKDDDPATVIAALASNVGCQASLLTGGRWEVANHPHGKILIGRVKVSEDLADKLFKISGRQALFVAVLSKETKRTPVAWLPRAKQSKAPKIVSNNL